MTPGQRIDVIRGITKNLSDYDWSDVDLVLSQFKLPTSHSWEGDKNSYIIAHLQQSDDAVLKELGDYLNGDTTENTEIMPQPAADGIWSPNKFRLFISHLTENKLLVSEVKERLKAYGVDCFVAHEDIDPTLEWQDVIETGLHSCDALAAFLTTNFHASNWTDQEIGFCVARRILIIPIKIDINPYGFIGKFQAKDCSKLTPSEIAENIFGILSESPLTSAKLDEAIVASFVDSKSWESARARSLLLSKVKTWTPELLRSIESSLENNSHIPSAFGVPERVRSILSANSQ